MKKLSRLLLMTFLCTILIQIQAFAAELQLNPDALYGVVRNNNQEQSLRLDQLFITSKSVYTYDELKECLRKYGTVVISEEEGGWYETIVDEQGKPIIRFFFEVGYDGNMYPSDWEFPVEFYSPGDLFWSETLPSYHVDSAVDSEAFIERVSQINHGWNLDGWHWDNINGDNINGYWTYYHNNVKNVNIWDNIEGKWYYFKEDGSMVHSGLHEINGNLYYFAESGAMETDWHKIPDDESGSWYYFSPQSGALMGAALKGGPHDIAGQKYQFEQDGTLIWDKIVQGNDGVLHYYTKGGPMLFGAADGSTKVVVDGKSFTIDANGVAKELSGVSTQNTGFSKDNPELHIRQTRDSSYCTVDSVAMMMRAKAGLDGNTNWKAITEQSAIAQMWTDSMKEAGSYEDNNNGLSMIFDEIHYNQVPSDKLTYIKQLLAEHPEGIVCWFTHTGSDWESKGMHAVYVTKTENDIIYAWDPAQDGQQTPLPISQTTLGKYYGFGDNQAAILQNDLSIWIITAANNH